MSRQMLKSLGIVYGAWIIGALQTAVTMQSGIGFAAISFIGLLCGAVLYTLAMINDRR